MTITAYPSTPRADASALLAFDGPANVLVAWSVTAGPGHIVTLSEVTDASGRAWAVYYPDGGSGSATVRVDHGA